MSCISGSNLSTNNQQPNVSIKYYNGVVYECKIEDNDLSKLSLKIFPSAIQFERKFSAIELKGISLSPEILSSNEKIKNLIRQLTKVDSSISPQSSNSPSSQPIINLIQKAFAEPPHALFQYKLGEYLLDKIPESECYAFNKSFSEALPDFDDENNYDFLKKTNRDKAIELFRRSANLGFAQAQYRLSLLLEKSEEAGIYFYESLKQGYWEAIKGFLFLDAFDCGMFDFFEIIWKFNSETPIRNIWEKVRELMLQYQEILKTKQTSLTDKKSETISRKLLALDKQFQLSSKILKIQNLSNQDIRSQLVAIHLLYILLKQEGIPDDISLYYPLLLQKESSYISPLDFMNAAYFAASMGLEEVSHSLMKCVAEEPNVCSLNLYFELAKAAFEKSLISINDQSLKEEDGIDECFDPDHVQRAESYIKKIDHQAFREYAYIHLAHLSAQSNAPDKEKITKDFIRKSGYPEDLAYYCLAKAIYKIASKLQGEERSRVVKEIDKFPQLPTWTRNFISYEKIKLDINEDQLAETSRAKLFSNITEFMFHINLSGGEFNSDEEWDKERLKVYILSIKKIKEIFEKDSFEELQKQLGSSLNQLPNNMRQKFTESMTELTKNLERFGKDIKEEKDPIQQLEQIFVSLKILIWKREPFADLVFLQTLILIVKTSLIILEPENVISLEPLVSLEKALNQYIKSHQEISRALEPPIKTVFFSIYADIFMQGQFKKYFALNLWPKISLMSNRRKHIHLFEKIIANQEISRSSTQIDAVNPKKNSPDQKLVNYYKIVKLISDDTVQWINELCKKIQQFMKELPEYGEPPERFSVFSMGSLVRHESGFFTDFEVGIILEKNSLSAQKYFQEFSQRLADALYLLGEHPDLGGKGAHLDIADNAPPHKRFAFRRLAEEQISDKMRKAIGQRQKGDFPVGGSRVFLLEYRSFAELFKYGFIDSLDDKGIPELDIPSKDTILKLANDILTPNPWTEDIFKGEYLENLTQKKKDELKAYNEQYHRENTNKEKEAIQRLIFQFMIKKIKRKMMNEFIGESSDSSMKKRAASFAKQILKPFSSKEIQVARSVPELGRNIMCLYSFKKDSNEPTIFERFIYERNKHLNAETPQGFIQGQFISYKTIIELLNQKVTSTGLLTETVKNKTGGELPKKIDLKRQFYRIPEQILTGLYWYYKIDFSEDDIQNTESIISKLFNENIISEETHKKFLFIMNISIKFRLQQQIELKGDCHDVYFDEKTWEKEIKEIDQKLSESKTKKDKWESIFKSTNNDNNEYTNEIKIYKELEKKKDYLIKVGPDWFAKIHLTKERKKREEELFIKGFKVLREIVEMTQIWITQINAGENGTKAFGGADISDLTRKKRSQTTSSPPSELEILQETTVL